MNPFSCQHANYTFPQTPRRIPRIRAARVTGTYVCCLDCGKELAYDWQEMKIVKPVRLWKRIMEAMA